MYVGAGFVSAGLRLYVHVPLIVDMCTSVREREAAAVGGGNQNH